MVIGRPLDIKDITQANEGETNYILVDRNQLLETAFDEIRVISSSNLRLTLEVQFYNEVAADYGGPRKEFFRLVLIEIQEKYFEHGLRIMLSKDYETVGKIFALSILQNGKIPRMMSEDVLNELFNSTKPSPCISALWKGLDALGLYERVDMTLLTKDQYKEIKATFRSIDTNGDGRLSIKEFKEAASKMGQNVTTKQVKEMFKLIDDNGDDYLSYKEYEKMMVEQLESQIVEHQFLEKCFSKMDVNRDGTITANEISKTMKIPKAEADELVREGDTDGDGELTFEEFVTVYRGKQD